MRFEIAQLNVSRALAPLDAPQLADFVAQLDAVNAIAEASPGFRWRLQGESGNATGVRVEGDPLLIVNLTVWATVEDLHAFTYRSGHRAVLARRSEWFERPEGPSTVLWWQPEGTIPELGDALRRLELLADHGPTPEAFTFKRRFEPPHAPR